MQLAGDRMARNGCTKFTKRKFVFTRLHAPVPFDVLEQRHNKRREEIFHIFNQQNDTTHKVCAVIYRVLRRDIYLFYCFFFKLSFRFRSIIRAVFVRCLRKLACAYYFVVVL